MINYKKKIIIAALSGLILGFASFYLFFYIKNLIEERNISHNAKNTVIVISKDDQHLFVFDVLKGKIKEYRISTGKNPGNKLTEGDLKTPEGVFPVIGVEESSNWAYDFKDGKGPVKGAYGPHFFRLNVGETNLFHNVDTSFQFVNDRKFHGIGIHGTHLDESLGKRSSHGCVRMNNNDLKDLKQYMRPGTLVVIVPGRRDILENITLKLARENLK